MQLKGLVRFFTILLIVYSLYQLSFTFFVKGHEKKMEAKAKAYVKNNFAAADVKYPNNKDSQAIYQETLEKVYQDRLKRLLDSTKDVTVTYGFNGPVSYQKAKNEELNLGLDLQGGMNVTLEVAVSEIIKGLSNKSNDPAFLKALDNATLAQRTSSKDYVTLFGEQYRLLNPTGRLAINFQTIELKGKIDFNTSDEDVLKFLKQRMDDAIETAEKTLRTRIDKFGVTQPNIQRLASSGRILIELPGVTDKKRVRKLLQGTANLEFWIAYDNAEEKDGIATALGKDFFWRICHAV